MVRGVKSTSKKPETSIHHHGLMKLLVVHALRKQGSIWKQLLQQKFSQEGVSKSIEEHETKACTEGSSRKTRERNIGMFIGRVCLSFMARTTTMMECLRQEQQQRWHDH